MSMTAMRAAGGTMASKTSLAPNSQLLDASRRATMASQISSCMGGRRQARGSAAVRRQAGMMRLCGVAGEGGAPSGPGAGARPSWCGRPGRPGKSAPGRHLQGEWKGSTVGSCPAPGGAAPRRRPQSRHPTRSCSPSYPTLPNSGQNYSAHGAPTRSAGPNPAPLACKPEVLRQLHRKRGGGLLPVFLRSMQRRHGAGLRYRPA